MGLSLAQVINLDYPPAYHLSCSPNRQGMKLWYTLASICILNYLWPTAGLFSDGLELLLKHSLSIGADRFEQTVQTQIRLLLKGAV